YRAKLVHSPIFEQDEEEILEDLFLSCARSRGLNHLTRDLTKNRDLLIMPYDRVKKRSLEILARSPKLRECIERGSKRLKHGIKRRTVRIGGAKLKENLAVLPRCLSDVCHALFSSTCLTGRAHEI